MKPYLQCLFVCLLLTGTLCQAQQFGIVMPVGHSDHIRSCQFSPDSKYVVTGSADGTSKLWEVSTGRLLYTVQGTSPFFILNGQRLVTANGVYETRSGSLLFDLPGLPVVSPDEKTLAVAHTIKLNVSGIAVAVKSCKLWDIASGKVTHTFQITDTERGTDYLYFSPDARYLVAVVDHEGMETEFSIWDVQTGANILEEPGIYFDEFSPDGRYAVGRTAYLYSKQDSPRAILFDMTTGKEVSSFSDVLNLDFTPDGKMLIASNDQQISIADAHTFEVNHTFPSPDELVDSLNIRHVLFSPDSRQMLIGRETFAELYDLTSFGDPVMLSSGLFKDNKDSYAYPDFQFSPDGRYLIVAVSGRSPELWSTPSLTLLGIYPVSSSTSYREDPAIFSANGSLMYLRMGVNFSDYEPDKPLPRWPVWSIGNFEPIARLENSLWAFSPDSQWMAIEADPLTDEKSKETYGHQVIVRSILSKMELPLMGISGLVEQATFSADGASFYTVLLKDRYSSIGASRILWETTTGRVVFKSKSRLQFHPTEPEFAVETSDNHLEIRSAKTGDTLKTVSLPNHRFWNFNPLGNLIASYDDLTYSPSGQYMAYGTSDDLVEIWDVSQDRLLQTLKPGYQSMGAASVYCSFSPDNRELAFYSSLDAKLYVTQIRSGKSKLLEADKLLGGSNTWIDEVVYSPDNALLAISTFQKTAFLHARKYQLLNTIETSDFRFSPDGRRLLASDPRGVLLYDPSSWQLIKNYGFAGFALKDVHFPTNRALISRGPELVLLDLLSGDRLLNLTLLDSSNWVVTHPSGLFDATPGAMEKLYFVSGLETIELSQLKARYYEPGLWKKVMSGDPLRSVMGFNKVDLPPEIKLSPVDRQGQLPVEVINKGGGIGEVTLYINGKEAIRDMRPQGSDPDAEWLAFTVPVAGHKNLISGKENFLAVKAWNSDKWIESRGVAVGYRAPAKSEIKPAIHIIACGVSDYTGNEIDLKYAAKDADDMARALTLAANRLFGTEKSFVYALTGSIPALAPTKPNLLKTFETISKSATVEDVIVLYLSGHGINVGGAEGDFYFLTQEAFSASPSAYADPALRQQSTLSSRELVELFKTIPALKQVMIIDACASGRVVENLMVRRDIESGTLRALDRMKDRTGMHIITGCAADAVSYEASRYGQGVLTYSLLEGMRGLALREDKYADVIKLFQYAQDRVPILASGIGGIQKPQVFSPNGSQSFDIGEISADDKRSIPLAKAKPIYIRSNFIDETKLKDALALGKMTDEQLNEISSRGSQSPLFFVDVSEYPEGCQLSGLYKQLTDRITLRINVTCEGKENSYELEATTSEELITKILQSISMD